MLSLKHSAFLGIRVAYGSIKGQLTYISDRKEQVMIDVNYFEISEADYQ
jgi:hypothetical protein